MSDYVVTAKVGNNGDLFPDILKLYVPKGSLVLDMTFGMGVFWRKVDHRIHGQDIGTGDYYVYANDIDPIKGYFHHDFRHLPKEWAGKFDAVVLDPPYLYTGGFKTLKFSLDKGYNNKARNDAGIHGVEAVDQLYLEGMQEAQRVLKPRGILIVKSMDQVQSGRQVWAHMTYSRYAVEMLGMENTDLFVLVQDHQPLMRHPAENQKHARRNHSYFQIFRKGKAWPK